MSPLRGRLNARAWRTRGASGPDRDIRARVRAGQSGDNFRETRQTRGLDFRPPPARMRLRLLTLVPLAAALASERAGAQQCDPNNGGLKLPPGFCARLFADGLATPRQLDVAANGDVVVALMGRGRDTSRVPGGIVVLRDADGDGRADRRVRSHGDFRATTVKVVGNIVYTENTTAILRYRWNPGSMTLSGPDTIVGGLPGERSHAPKTFAIKGNTLYVNHGAPSNACQERDRVPESPGLDPCPELETRGGIWTFARNRTGQTLKSGKRFATGIRNAVAIAVEPRSGDLYVVQHGRDQLSNNWPKLFSDAKNAESPAEELFLVKEGDDFGWPYCYFDPEIRKNVLAPEYGGDGTTEGRCSRAKSNVGWFPAHWAPNSLMFYTGSMLPARYRDGAFIVFHGSWNRAPLPQQGFKAVFQPMENGRAVGDFEVFVDGFYADGQPTELGGRPMALAQGPRGELYLTDSSRGRIWKITYTGR